jgi:pimeloyl-ACP methyl ester carboxylesterase
VIERILRTASSFRELEEYDRRDLARLSLEERISAVEKLRRIWFGEDPAKSRLERVLVASDLQTAMAADSWPHYDPAPYAGQWAQTTVPMLMMNGGLDPATPLAGALTVKDHFQGQNQTFVTFADEGHGAEGQSPTDVFWSHDCGLEIVDQFFDDPTAQLDTSCLGSVLPLNFSGTPLANKQLWNTTDVWENTATAPAN